jgi:hypothetical protein
MLRSPATVSRARASRREGGILGQAVSERTWRSCVESTRGGRAETSAPVTLRGRSVIRIESIRELQEALAAVGLRE